MRKMNKSMRVPIALMTFSLVVSFLSALSISQQFLGWYIHLKYSIRPHFQYYLCTKIRMFIVIVPRYISSTLSNEIHYHHK